MNTHPEINNSEFIEDRPLWIFSGIIIFQRFKGVGGGREWFSSSCNSKANGFKVVQCYLSAGTVRKADTRKHQALREMQAIIWHR